MIKSSAGCGEKEERTMCGLLGVHTWREQRDGSVLTEDRCP